MKTNITEKQNQIAQNFNLKIDKIDVNKTYYVDYELVDESAIIEKFSGERLLSIAENVIDSLTEIYSNSEDFDVNEHKLNLFRSAVYFYAVTFDEESCEDNKEFMPDEIKDVLNGDRGKQFELYTQKEEFVLFHFFNSDTQDFFEQNDIEVYDIIFIYDDESGIKVASDGLYSQQDEKGKRLLDESSF